MVVRGGTTTGQTAEFNKPSNDKMMKRVGNERLRENSSSPIMAHNGRGIQGKEGCTH